MYHRQLICNGRVLHRVSELYIQVDFQLLAAAHSSTQRLLNALYKLKGLDVDSL